MADKRLVSRRKFIKIAGGVIGAGVLACGGGAYLGLRTPASVRFPSADACGGNGKKLLVAYASKCGSTAEIAEAVAKTLCAGGINAALSSAEKIKSLQGFDGVILGSAIYMGSPLKSAEQFVDRFSEDLATIPAAVFGVCLTMKDASSQNESTALAYLAPLTKKIKPVSTIAFAGRIDHASLPTIYRFFSQADNSGILAEGDFRDWGVINGWASQMTEVFTGYA